MNIHPFPAKMAPSLAKDKLSQFRVGSKILDPMCGSGTTLRHSIEKGHSAVGWDIDPLAVKISRVWCYRYNTKRLHADQNALKLKLNKSKNTKCRFSNCEDTRNFVDYWFAKKQKDDLNRLSLEIEKTFPKGPRRDFFQIAMSRIIITKFKGASLAWDISHSRPHKKKVENDFDTIPEFFKSVEKMIHQIKNNPCQSNARIYNGDCKKVKSSEKFDAVITSPPYLNAIDYMRGHKFSLIWMGYTIPELKNIRQKSIGSEKGDPSLMDKVEIQTIAKTVCKGQKILPRVEKFLFRYIDDCENLIAKLKKHLTPQGSLIFVVGNSTQYGTRIHNDRIFSLLAKKHGFKLNDKKTRKIPQNARYLPINDKTQISKRIKTETVLHFINN